MLIQSEIESFRYSHIKMVGSLNATCHDVVSARNKLFSFPSNSAVDLLRVDKSSPVAVINHDIKPACVLASKRIAIFFL